MKHKTFKKTKYRKKWTKPLQNHKTTKKPHHINTDIIIRNTRDTLKIQNYNKSYVIHEKHIKIIGLDITKLKNLLETKYGLKLDTSKNAPLKNHLFGIFGTAFYKTQFYMGFGFNLMEDITNKYLLYYTLKYNFPVMFEKYVPNFYILKINMKYEDFKHKIYIARPVEAHLGSGKDIIIVDNETKFNEAKKLILKYPDGVNMTEYIENIALYNGRKMHLRSYFMITVIDNVFNSYLLDSGNIYLAKLQYKKGDYNNPDIHDTHFKSTGAKLFYPKDFEGNMKPTINQEIYYEKILPQMRDILYYVSRIAFSNIKLYNNTKNAYVICGVDFMIRNDYSVFMLEVNGKFTGYSEIMIEPFISTYFKWLDDLVLCHLNPIHCNDTKTNNTKTNNTKQENYNSLSNKPIYTSSII